MAYNFLKFMRAWFQVPHHLLLAGSFSSSFERDVGFLITMDVSSNKRFFNRLGYIAHFILEL